MKVAGHVPRRALAALLVAGALGAGCSMWGTAQAVRMALASDASEAATASALSHVPDYTRTGSLTVDVLDTAAGKPVGGGTLTLYKVADAMDVDGSQEFVLTDEFASSGVELGASTFGDNGAHALAAKLARYATAQSLTGTTVAVPSTGQVQFETLDLGLYLVVQAEAASGYVALEPFCVTVPMRDGDEYLYDVVAYPKPGTVAAQTTPPPTPSTPSTPLAHTGDFQQSVQALAVGGGLLLATGLAVLRRTRVS